MRTYAFLLGFIAATTGISTAAASGVRNERSAVNFVPKHCPMYLRHENNDRTLEPFPFIRPEHLVSISLARPLYPGNKAIWIQLTPAGSERLFRETQGFVGSRIAIFCGNNELERATLVAPIKASGFRVDLPDRSDT
jgi:hypothetical protein